MSRRVDTVASLLAGSVDPAGDPLALVALGAAQPLWARTSRLSSTRRTPIPGVARGGLTGPPHNVDRVGLFTARFAR